MGLFECEGAVGLGAAFFVFSTAAAMTRIVSTNFRSHANDRGFRWATTRIGANRFIFIGQIAIC